MSELPNDVKANVLNQRIAGFQSEIYNLKLNLETLEWALTQAEQHLAEIPTAE